ncbi:MAG: hypothetical protein ABIW80_11260, partial [Lapillicoccus sp.]
MADHAVLPRRVRGVHAEASGVTLDLDAIPGVQLGMMPGWLTGEPLREQGVETQMPNLPTITLPPTDVTPYALRVTAPVATGLRLVLAPAGDPALSDDGTGRGIVVDPAPEPTALEVEEQEDAVVVRSGALRLTIGRSPFTMVLTDVATGATVLRTADRLRQVAGLLTAPSAVVDGRETTLNLELGPDEDILGFGEQFGRLIKNGQLLRLRSEDACGTGTGLAYKPVPVWHSSRGYTGFINTGAVVTADVGHSRPSVLSLGVDDAAIDLYVVA